MKLSTILFLLWLLGSPFVAGIGYYIAQGHKVHRRFPMGLAVAFFGVYTFLYMLLGKILDTMGFLVD